jgi:hypothetical protein
MNGQPSVLIAAWNMVETAYKTFIELIFPNHLTAGLHVYELLGNDERVKLIRGELSETLNKQENDLLEHFFKAANICKAYRNVIAHSNYSPRAYGERIILRKGMSKDRNSVNLFYFSVTGVREMADATYCTAKFGLDLRTSVLLRTSNESLVRRGMQPNFSLALPEKPPLPRSWDQIREAPKPPPNQPQSSRA